MPEATTSPELRQARRTLPVPRQVPEGCVRQFLAAAGAAEHQAAAAHIAAPDEFLGKQQSVAEHRNHRREILDRRDTAEEDEVAVAAGEFVNAAARTLERAAVERVVSVNGNGGDGAKMLEGDDRLRRNQAHAGGNHEGAGQVGGWRGKGLRVSELAAEVQTADE